MTDQLPATISQATRTVLALVDAAGERADMRTSSNSSPALITETLIRLVQRHQYFPLA